MPIDMSLAPPKAPPRKATGTGVKTTRLQAVQPEKTQHEKRMDGLHGLAQLFQGGLLAAGMYADAATLGGPHLTPFITEIVNVADEQEVIAKPIDFLIQTGPYAALLATGMPLVLQFLANHHVIDASRLLNQGVVPPAVLEAQIGAQVAKMQADALRAQQQAIADAEKARRDFEAMTTMEFQTQAA